MNSDKPKKRRMRLLVLIPLVLVALIGVLILIFSLRGGTLVKSMVNTLGPTMIGVPVSVEDVSFYPLVGHVELKNLVVGNPEGFDSPHLFKMELLKIDVAMASLLTGSVRIKEIIVSGPQVIFHKKLTTSNVNELLKILEEKYPPSDEKKDKDKKEKKDSSSVVIDRLVVNKGSVTFKLGANLPLPLAPLELNDIGKDGAWMPAQVITYVIKQIVYGVFKAIGGVGELAIDGATAVGGAVGKGAASVGKGAASVVKGIGSLFSSNETNAVDTSTEQP